MLIAIGYGQKVGAEAASRPCGSGSCFNRLTRELLQSGGQRLGRPVRKEQAQGILVAALGMLAADGGHSKPTAS
jgi:hypothetical protein